MGDVFAIVSKAVFEKEARLDGSVIGLGDVWPIAIYNGTGKVFESTLAGGGRIFMVTVRPPDEGLWLLAILESPKFDGKKKGWVAAPNVVPVVDLTSLRKTIQFESGKGMSQGKGALGMSLQTPRALGPGDAEQILALCGGGSPTAKKSGAASGKPAMDAKKSTRTRDRVAALLSAIRDEPDDAANREVLADQYEAGGDPDRANFIRSQAARAELPRWDPRAVAMQLDERGFLRDHAAAWRAELPTFKGVRWGDFERGIVAWLVFDDAALIPKHIEAAMAACPITGVMMRWPRRNARPKLAAIEGLRSLVVSGTLLQNADLTWLAKSPVLSTVEELTLEHSELDDEALGILLDSPHLGKLRRLRLPFHQLGNAGIERLTEASLPRLVELGLAVETMDRLGSGGRDGDGINGDGIVALCEWPQMAKLERLDLTGIQLGEAGLTAILSSKNTKRLTSLRLRSVSDYDFENDERPEVLQAFAHAKDDRHFEELDIGENELSSDGVKALTSSPALQKLRIFSFDFSQDDSALGRLLDAKWLDAVHILSLNETTMPVVKKVLNRELASLHTLSVTSSFPRSNLKGIVTTLTSAPKQKALQSLDLFGCDIDDAALKKLGAATTLPALIALRVGVNSESGYSDDEEESFSEAAVEAFLGSPLGKQLRSVVVGIEELDRLPPLERVTLDADDDDDDDDDDE
ncbi:MAG: hypothetical protein ABI867_16250 [Kofleriaceae bacterium]